MGRRILVVDDEARIRGIIRGYLESDESHELGEAFRAKRKPDADKFGR